MAREGVREEWDESVAYERTGRLLSRRGLDAGTSACSAGMWWQYLGDGQLALPSVRGKETSTRRFFLRPSSVELSAIGNCSP